jgi:hypothetical protein
LASANALIAPGRRARAGGDAGGVDAPFETKSNLWNRFWPERSAPFVEVDGRPVVTAREKPANADVDLFAKVVVFSDADVDHLAGSDRELLNENGVRLR